MKLVRTILALALCTNFIASAQTDSLKKKEALTWHTDIVKAAEISKSTGRPLFAFFTGSDWCGWCMKLQRDVFAKPEFIKWAKTNVVLVELDFPRGKSLSPELTQQNNSLQQTFQVTGYPTIWMFFLSKAADGSKYDIEALGSLGYPQGSQPGKEQLKFLKDAKTLIEKKKS